MGAEVFFFQVFYNMACAKSFGTFQAFSITISFTKYVIVCNAHGTMAIFDFLQQSFNYNFGFHCLPISSSLLISSFARRCATKEWLALPEIAHSTRTFHLVNEPPHVSHFRIGFIQPVGILSNITPQNIMPHFKHPPSWIGDVHVHSNSGISLCICNFLDTFFRLHALLLKVYNN